MTSPAPLSGVDLSSLVLSAWQRSCPEALGDGGAARRGRHLARHLGDVAASARVRELLARG